METVQNEYQKAYLTKVQNRIFWMLLAHVPAIAATAFYFKTGFLTNLILGSIIFAGPLFFHLTSRGKEINSFVQSIAFMCFSALLIHAGQGMIEMHFHIFVGLALCIIFANPYAILAAAATIALHHVSFYFLLPKSIFNYNANLYIVALHAGFVVFETVPAMFIANNFRKVILMQGTLIRQLKNSSEQINISSESLLSNNQELSQSVNSQAAALHQTVSATDEISAMVKKNSENAIRSQDVSNLSQSSAIQGQKAVQDVLQSISEIEVTNQEIFQEIQNNTQQLVQITNMIQQIGSKTQVINDIVFQTKLLSFNASVEAARAGEHGKGFSVVAEEVGNLAQMSGNAAKEITTLLGTSITEVNQIVETTKAKVSRLVQQGQSRIADGTQKSKNCQMVLEEILKNVSEVNQLVTEIATASTEQDRGVQEITRAVSDIHQSTQQNATRSTESSQSAQTLHQEAETLEQIVQQMLITMKDDEAA